MKTMLQNNYNKNRITYGAPEQSRFFFGAWKDKGLWAAIKWFYKFKRERHRVVSDLLGSTMVALGLENRSYHSSFFNGELGGHS